MKKCLIFSYLALSLIIILNNSGEKRTETADAGEFSTGYVENFVPMAVSESVETADVPQEPDRSVITVLVDGAPQELGMDEYIIGVTAAEMPASFEPEALKAQAVAARSYALYCARGRKHGDADVCTDPACCQAWQSREEMRSRWGDAFENNLAKLENAVLSTSGLYLSYDGAAVFAAFHSSSAGSTEDCGELWSPLPYLVSVESPETEDDVPNYISTVASAPLDFRDTVLHDYPEADFTAPRSEWVGELIRDESGRVKTAVIGGAEIDGSEIRRLFSLRSTSFRIDYTGSEFVFTVTGYGHGVGMSQYGANVMAQNGSDFAEILSHYYPGTELCRMSG